jgi:hypothetical protein
MSDNFKRKTVVFNLDNEDDSDLYEMCERKSKNFSGFIKRVLFLYKNSQIMNGSIHEEGIEVPTDVVDDRDKMKGLL